MPQQHMVAPQRLPGRNRLSESSTGSDDHGFYSKKAKRIATTQSQVNISRAVATLEKLSESAEEVEDMHYHFALDVAASLRHNMEGLRREQAKLEIMQILIKYHRENV
jgi:hypothetical protein